MGRISKEGVKMSSSIPNEYWGKFRFICVKCLSSWEKPGNSKESAKSTCQKCGTETEGSFEMFDPDEDVDAT